MGSIYLETCRDHINRETMSFDPIKVSVTNAWRQSKKCGDGRCYVTLNRFNEFRRKHARSNSNTLIIVSFRWRACDRSQD